MRPGPRRRSGPDERPVRPGTRPDGRPASGRPRVLRNPGSGWARPGSIRPAHRSHAWAVSGPTLSRTTSASRAPGWLPFALITRAAGAGRSATVTVTSPDRSSRAPPRPHRPRPAQPGPGPPGSVIPSPGRAGSAAQLPRQAGVPPGFSRCPAPGVPAGRGGQGPGPRGTGEQGACAGGEASCRESRS